MGFLFQRLLFKTLIEQAITAEEEAFLFYRDLQENPAFSPCSTLLQKLSSEELKHRIRLEEAQKTYNLGKLDPSSDKEKALLNEQEKPWCDPDEEESVEKTLSLALEKEESSYAFYSLLRDKTKNPQAKKIFQELAQQEKHHIEWVQDALDSENI